MAGRLRLFSVALLFLWFLQPASAVFSGESAITVQASVDKDKIAQDEPLTFKIEISGDFNSSPRIELPDWKKDFDVVSTVQSQSVHIQGREQKRQLVFLYVLMARSTGKLDIGQVTVKVGKEIFKTENIAVEVAAAKNPLPQQPPEEVPEESDQQQFVI